MLCADSDVDSDPELVTEDQLLNESDLIVIATPHTRYRTLRTKKLVVDLANVLGKGTTI